MKKRTIWCSRKSCKKSNNENPINKFYKIYSYIHILIKKKNKIGNTNKFQFITMKNPNSNKKMKSLFSNYSSLLDNRRARL